MDNSIHSTAICGSKLTNVDVGTDASSRQAFRSNYITQSKSRQLCKEENVTEYLHEIKNRLSYTK